VLSAAGRDSYLLAKDERALFRWHCREVNAASTSLTNDGVAMRGFHILHQSDSGPSIDTR
jgi:hypothetical protein